MPTRGYTKRFFTPDFKMRTIYELKTGLKKQSDILDTSGRVVSKTLTDRWMKQFPVEVPASTQFIPAPQVKERDAELIQEIDRLNVKLARYAFDQLMDKREMLARPKRAENSM